jgi:hypothetical protein
MYYSRPDYDPKLPLNGYSVALIGRLSKRTSILQKQIEQLGGTIATTIDKTTDVIISTQGYFSFIFYSFFFYYNCSIDEVQKGNKKIQNAQTFEIHIVSEEFLEDILNDRPSIVMEKLKLSTWGILPHIRKQQVHEKKKPKEKSSTTLKSFREYFISRIPFESLSYSSIKKVHTGKNDYEIKGWCCSRS